MGTQGLECRSDKADKEQVTFLFPHPFVGAGGITGMLLPNRRKPGYANNLRRGGGREREMGTR